MSSILKAEPMCAVLFCPAISMDTAVLTCTLLLASGTADLNEIYILSEIGRAHV